MQPGNLGEMTDEEVMDRLDNAYLAHVLEEDPKWKIVFRWLKKERDLAQRRLQSADPSKQHEIVRCQEVIRICEHLADKIFNGVKKDGELALLEAQDRGLVPETEPEPSETPIAGS
jgi:hypothetical protein